MSDSAFESDWVLRGQSAVDWYYRRYKAGDIALDRFLSEVRAQFDDLPYESIRVTATVEPDIHQPRQLTIGLDLPVDDPHAWTRVDGVFEQMQMFTRDLSDEPRTQREA